MRDQPSAGIAVLISVFVLVAMVRAAALEPGTMLSQDFDPRELSMPTSSHGAVYGGDEQERAARAAVHAIADAYPERVDGYVRRNGDWALSVDGTWFYWSDGRLLPDDMREYRDEFAAMRFYEYRVGEHQPPEIPEELAETLRERAEEGKREPLWLTTGRHQEFYESLYGFDNARDADRVMQRTSFLGRTTRVHPMVVEPLEEVESDIRDAMQDSAEVVRFVDNLATVSGYYWRDIFGSISRSYHAYGIAVDLLPRRYDGFGFWRWAQQSGIEEWWSLSREQRHSVPEAVIDAFERHGFVWGGKWIGFDPVHFEYRPEVIRYARMREEDPSLPSLY